MLNHLFALGDEQSALELDVVHLARHLEGCDLALAFQAAQHAQVIVWGYNSFLPIDADTRLVSEVQPGDRQVVPQRYFRLFRNLVPQFLQKLQFLRAFVDGDIVVASRD